MPGAGRIGGPFPVRPEDIGPLNAIFSDAFSERYRRDGMAGVRVPPLNPAIWRFAIEGAGGGAMLWRDAAGEIAAFNFAHALGAEGWMGPLAVREDLQGMGIGRRIVEAGIERLKAAGCTTIGLETMPRTMDNIGFYASLGFAPGGLTITVTMDAVTAPPPRVLGQLPAAARDARLQDCVALVQRLRPGADYSRELQLTLRHGLGDAVLLEDAEGRLQGFALYHEIPLVEGRSREELRVLKLAVEDAATLPALMRLVQAQARRAGTLRAAVRLQGEFPGSLPQLVAQGARVRWTDLRMTLRGYAEAPARGGLVLSNWEI